MSWNSWSDLSWKSNAAIDREYTRIEGEILDSIEPIPHTGLFGGLRPYRRIELLDEEAI